MITVNKDSYLRIELLSAMYLIFICQNVNTNFVVMTNSTHLEELKHLGRLH